MGNNQWFVWLTTFVPILPIFVLSVRGRGVLLSERLLAVGFLVSVVTDLWMRFGGWWIFYIYAPLQVAFFCYAVNGRVKTLFVVSAALAFEAAVLLAVEATGAVGMHERMAGLVASVVLVSVVWWVNLKSPFMPAVLTYAGFGSVGFLMVGIAMADADPGRLFWVGYWWYHLCKFVGVGLAVYALIRPTARGGR